MAGRDFYLWQARGFTVRLATDMVDRMNAVLSDPKRRCGEEQGGILLGTLPGPAAAEITGFEFVRSEHRRGVAYDLGLKERGRLTRYVQRLRRRKGEFPVGYFRTHRRPWLFLDQDDFAVMTDTFTDPACTALLIAPGTNAGFFFWENEDIDRTRTQLPFPFESNALREKGPMVTVRGPAGKPESRNIPAWQALAMAALAAVAGYGLVSATQQHPRPVTVPPPSPIVRPQVPANASGTNHVGPKKVSVAVSIEQKTSASPFTRVVAEVPGLRELQNRQEFVPARPDHSVTPRVPEYLAANLSREQPVDVKVSIDKHGVVQDTEILNGGSSAFGSIAADNAFWTQWQPAREGERSVPSEMIVNYRFRPASAEPH